MRSEVLAVSIVVLIVAAIGAVSVAGTGSHQGASSSASTTSGSTSPTFQETTNTSSVSPPGGIQLSLVLNATSLQVGQELNVAISISNMQPTVNVVRTANNWPFQGVPVALWPPCYFGIPAQVVVLQGNYSLHELKVVADVPFNYVCMEAVSVDHAIFQARSDRANLTGIYDVTDSNQTLGPFQLEKNFTTNGYWNLQSLAGELNIPVIGDGANPNVPPNSTSFTPGVYTVAAADEWGQYVLLHFTVTQNGEGGASLLIHVLNDTSGQPVARIKVLAGPASSMDDIAYTPGGPTVKECVHQVPSGSSVLANGTAVFPNGTVVNFPPCPLSTYPANSTGWVTISGITATYYFFCAGNAMSSFNSFGIVQLSQGEATYVTVKAPSGNYTVTN